MNFVYPVDFSVALCWIPIDGCTRVVAAAVQTSLEMFREGSEM